jgi:hypothetical protein
MNTHNSHRDYRLTQTIAIISLLTAIWLVVQYTKPAEQFHYVNFGKNAQLISVTPVSTRVKIGQPIKFTIKWWLSAPLPANHNISYYVRNQQQALGQLDTNSIKSLDLAYTQIPTQGLMFSDQLEIPTKRNLAPGIHEVVTFIYPPEDFKINAGQGSSLYNLQRVLFTIDVQP